MKTTFKILVLCVILNSCSTAEDKGKTILNDALISGLVTDAETGLGIDSVKVTLYSPVQNYNPIIAYSDKDGVFKNDSVDYTKYAEDKHEYFLIAQAEGYFDEMSEFFYQSEKVERNISLKKTATVKINLNKISGGDTAILVSKSVPNKIYKTNKVVYVTTVGNQTNDVLYSLFPNATVSMDNNSFVSYTKAVYSPSHDTTEITIDF